jgi:hypothetical protein
MTSETMQQELLHIIQRNSPDFLRRLLVNAVCLERAVKGSERGKRYDRSGLQAGNSFYAG